jgi:GDP-L-fucose synthase
MGKKDKIYIAGHKGLLGSAIKRKLEKEGYKNLVFRTHAELDLRNQKDTEDFFEKEKPDYVFMAAAKVGGIYANSNYKAEFLYDNLQMQNNLINSSYKSRVKKLLFIASNCMYPKDCPQPIKEECLLTGIPEPTNEAFAIAKIAGVKLCQYYNEQYGTNFISVVPCSLFGPNDNFDPNNSHFVAALIKKFYEARLSNKKEVILWGSGNPKREIMYVNDCTDACIFLMNNYNSSEPINIGVGKDMEIKEIAGIIKEIAEFNGKIIFDKTKPDGIIRKMLNSEKITALGWKPRMTLEQGLRETYRWFSENYENIK